MITELSCTRLCRIWWLGIKTLVFVSGVDDVPSKVRSHLHIVSANSWGDSILYLSGRRQDTAVFFAPGVPVDRFLKSVEDFDGSLLVYSVVDVDATMRSRFSRVLRGNRPIIWRSIGEPTAMELLLERVKKSICKT